MNPYYQIDEEPKRQSRAWIIVAIVAAAVAVVVLALVWALPKSGREPQRETGGESGRGTAGVSGDTEETRDALFESLWGTGDDETRAPGWSEITDIKLVPIYEYEEYTDAILRVMKVIRHMNGETVGRRIGLFDFECDGVPELVVMEPVEEEVPGQMTTGTFHELWVYDLASGERVASPLVAGGLNSLSVLVNREAGIELLIMLDEDTVLYAGGHLDASGQTWAIVDENYELDKVMREALYPQTGRGGYWLIGSQEVTQKVFIEYRQEYFRRNRREDGTKTAIETVWDMTVSDAEVVQRMFDENHEQWFVVAVRAE